MLLGIGIESNVDCRGHYSDAVLSSLESQNDAEVEGITAKVKMLKDVSISRASSQHTHEPGQRSRF